MRSCPASRSSCIAATSPSRKPCQPSGPGWSWPPAHTREYAPQPWQVASRKLASAGAVFAMMPSNVPQQSRWTLKAQRNFPESITCSPVAWAEVTYDPQCCTARPPLRRLIDWLQIANLWGTRSSTKERFKKCIMTEKNLLLPSGGSMQAKCSGLDSSWAICRWCSRAAKQSESRSRKTRPTLSVVIESSHRPENTASRTLPPVSKVARFAVKIRPPTLSSITSPFFGNSAVTAAFSLSKSFFSAAS
mmetsp:Transcript_25269/g.57390  ORF Transcript_25269/g.57390 Transcript_25269/m.57390 type:complete len:247 (+) Transcript_25269:134-874(+)